MNAPTPNAVSKRRSRRKSAHHDAAGSGKNGNDDGNDEARYDLPPLRHFVGYAVRRAQLRIYEDFYSSLAVEGITPARFTALMLIREHPGIRSTDLAQAMHIARSGVVKLLALFEQQELVQRQSNPDDRRAQGLVLTEHGVRWLAHVEAAIEEHDQRICAGLSDKEREQLVGLLSRVARHPR